MALNHTDEKDQTITRRLILAKHMFLHGAEHITHVGDLNKILAIHHFHNAVEIVLKAVCTHFGIHYDEKTKFHELIRGIETNEHVKGANLAIPNKAKLVQLNRARNMAQHDGLPPADTGTNEGRVFAEDTLREICRSYFKLDWDDLSQVDLIGDSGLRDLMQKGRALTLKEEYRKSIKVSYVAFVCASQSISSYLTQDYTLPLTVHDPYHGLGSLDEKIKFLLETMHALELNMILLHTGIHIRELRRFTDLRPLLGFTDGGQIYDYSKGPRSTPSGEDATWFQSFVTDQIVKWQTQGFGPTITENDRPTYEYLCHELEGSLSQQDNHQTNV